MTLPKLDGFARKVSDLLDRPNSTLSAADVKDGSMQHQKN